MAQNSTHLLSHSSVLRVQAQLSPLCRVLQGHHQGGSQAACSSGGLTGEEPTSKLTLTQVNDSTHFLAAIGLRAPTSFLSAVNFPQPQRLPSAPCQVGSGT